VFDLSLPLEQVAEGYQAMDERHAIKAPCCTRKPHSNAARHALRKPVRAVLVARKELD
jgi:hypothetical protein